MGLEIERKYIVNDISYKEMSSEIHHIIQGYMSREPRHTVRVRLVDDKGFLTVKGKNDGSVRQEFEYAVPANDAAEMLKLCDPPVIEKYRNIVDYCGHRWEVDEFVTSNGSTFTTAEIELKDKDEIFEIPPFVGRDVTDDPAYYNSNLKL